MCDKNHELYLECGMIQRIREENEGGLSNLESKNEESMVLRREHQFLEEIN